MDNISLVSCQVISSKNVPATTSLKIAEFTGLLHKNILQSIENLISSGKFNGLNFQLVEYKDKKGEMRKSYLLDEKFTSILLMGMTGEKALDWKIAYQESFTKMREELANKVIREKRDDYALLNECLNEVYKLKRKELGKETQHFHYSNLAKSVNKATFGHHEVGMRRDMEKSDSLRLGENLMSAVKLVMRGVVETKDMQKLLETKYDPKLLS